MFEIPKLTCYTLSWTADWSKYLGENRPLIVEFGFGNGDYLIELAKRHPDCNVIGFEIVSQCLEKAEKKIKANRLKNALVVSGRAETALAHLFDIASIRQIHINYPDPWFKKRHAKRRLMQRDTLDAIVSRLEDNGRLYLATDIVEYAEMSHELLQDTPQLTNLLSENWVNHLPDRLITTKYEAKGYAEGRVGNYFMYERNTTPALNIPVIRELPMPHVIIETPMSPEEIVKANIKQTFHPDDNIYVMIRDAFLHQDGQAMLYELNIEESTIDQHIAVMLYPRDEPNRYTVKYTTLGQPRITLGLHYATLAIAQVVVNLHPEARIIDSRLAVPVVPMTPIVRPEITPNDDE
jgi:tRNA (guanine-N7-)-methyltransferase